jgi:hypothetical protein
LAYRINGHSYLVHLTDYVTGIRNSVDREEFDSDVSAVKGQCKATAELLISQLDKRFSNSEIMEALHVVFPQYWQQEKCDEFFPMHLQVIKDWFSNLKVAMFGVGNEKEPKQVGALLDSRALDVQAVLFKLTMKSHTAKAMENPDSSNPVTRMWQRLGCNALLLSKLNEYMKLTEIAMTTVLGSCEDERTFSTLSFMKNKVRNRLHSNLDTCIRLFSQDWYKLESFPYHEAFDN